MKFVVVDQLEEIRSPSPHGEGGLKSALYGGSADEVASLPAWGGWIEISKALVIKDKKSPPPHGEGGLKYFYAMLLADLCPSLPAWGGWIEIVLKPATGYISFVPPRMGRVD